MRRLLLQLKIALALTAIGASVAHAEVLELEGSVKAVDATARSITIERKTPKGTKTLELEVNKKAGDLSTVKAGDKISFSYDPDLEVVTKLVSAEANAASIRVADELKGEFAAVTDDGLEVVFEAGDPLKGGELWQARRDSQGEKFSRPMVLFAGRHPTISGDGLTMVYLRREGDAKDAPFSLWATSRRSRKDAFAQGDGITELRAFRNARAPFLTSDGQSLVFRRIGERGGLVWTERKNSSNTWREPTFLIEEGVESDLGGAFTWSWLSNDGLTLVSTLEGKNTKSNDYLYVFKRETPDVMFAKPKPVTLPLVDRLVKCVRYVPDTKEVFMSVPAESGKIRILSLPSCPW